MKTSNTPAYETLDDIIFAHRHREYGAYDLRKAYPKVLRKALLLGIGSFLSLFILPTIYGKLKPKEDDYYMKEVEFTNLKLEQKTEKPLPKIEKPKELPKENTVRYRIPEVTDNPPHEDPPPAVDELENANSGQETVIGDADEVPVIAPPEDAPTPEVSKPAEVEARAPEVFERVEIEPEFVGGIDAFRTFLVKNLRYPNAAQRSNVQGKIYLHFIVEPDGMLSNIEVLRGIGFGCDEEAVRVMKLMPKWKPGKQSGRAVRVKFNMPIVFALE